MVVNGWVIAVCAMLSSASICVASGLSGNFNGILLDVLDMIKARLDFGDADFDSHIFCIIIDQSVLNTHSMEGMLAWENVEFTVEDWLEAQIAHLARIDGDVLVLLFSVLLSQVLSACRMAHEFSLQMLNLIVVVIQAIAQMLFHVLNFLAWREQWQQVVNLELRHFGVQDFKSF